MICAAFVTEPIALEATTLSVKVLFWSAAAGVKRNVPALRLAAPEYAGVIFQLFRPEPGGVMVTAIVNSLLTGAFVVPDGLNVMFGSAGPWMRTPSMPTLPVTLVT